MTRRAAAFTAVAVVSTTATAWLGRVPRAEPCAPSVRTMLAYRPDGRIRVPHVFEVRIGADAIELR